MSLLSKKNHGDAIGILGRGVSLKRCGCLNFLDEFIIVNTFNRELQQEPVKSLLKGKRITHLVNMCEVVLPPDLLVKYNVYKYLITRLKPDGSLKWFRQRRVNRNIERAGFKAERMPETVAPYLENACGAGTVSIIYAAIGLKKKHIYIAGIDFYEADYFTKSLKSKLKIEPNLTEIGIGMRAYITDFAARHLDINFYFITESSFQPDLPNVKVYNHGSEF